MRPRKLEGLPRPAVLCANSGMHNNACQQPQASSIATAPLQAAPPQRTCVKVEDIH